MKAIITGSSGFIGKHLIKRLQDWELISIPHEFLISQDSINRFLYENNNNSSPIDYIFNIQAYGNMHHQQDELQMVQANINNTVNLLEATKGMNYKGFIQFGSSSEYGSQHLPMNEDMKINPSTFYSATKASATHFIQAFSTFYRKRCVVIRPFSVYGPEEAHFRFIPTVILSTQRKQRFMVDEDAVHDWIYIDDFIDGVLTITLSNKDGVFNIGSETQSRNTDVISLLAQVMNQPIGYEKSPRLRKQDSSMWKSNSSKLRLLGWSTKHTLLEGLTKTYQHYKDL